MQNLITITDAAARLNRAQNRTLIRSLIRLHQIPTQKLGPAVVMDEAGFARLKEAVAAWDNRPRLNTAHAG